MTTEINDNTDINKKIDQYTKHLIRVSNYQKKNKEKMKEKNKKNYEKLKENPEKYNERLRINRERAKERYNNITKQAFKDAREALKNAN